jgi:hypothetical protein
VFEDWRAIALDRLTERDVAMPKSLHDILQTATAALVRIFAKVGAGHFQDVKSDHDGLSASRGREQPVEVTVAVRPKDHGLAIMPGEQPPAVVFQLMNAPGPRGAAA